MRLPFDLGAHAGELFFQPLEAAIEMIDAVDDGFAFGGEPRQHEADARAQIGRHHRRALEALDARDVAMSPSTGCPRPCASSGTCMKRFSKIVSLICDTPSAVAISAMNCACRSVGKPGNGASPYRPQWDARRCDGREPRLVSAISVPMDSSSGITAPISIGARVHELDLAAGDRHGHRIGAGLDAIGQHGMFRAVQRLHAFDHDRDVPSPNLRAHRNQAMARSSISGSRAALISTVSPSASAAAISVFSVAPTETKGNSMRAPLRPPAPSR
jgi:hypothetical protein